MRSAWVWLGLAVLAGCAGAGCARRVETAGGGVEGTPPAEYYPLAVGNRWTYDVRFLGQELQHSVELVGQREDGRFVDREGNAIGVDAYGVGDGKRYLLRPPLAPGHQWTTVVSVSSIERNEVLSVGKPCRAAAGAFADCVVVESRNRVDPKTTLVNTLTFARGVGIVRVETVAEVEGERVPQATRDLASFELRKTPPAEGEAR